MTTRNQTPSLIIHKIKLFISGHIQFGLLFILLQFGIASHKLQAQITVQKYAREITCDIESISELPTVQAESQFGGLQVHLEEEIFSGGCLGTLVRTFHFVDKAGEKATAMQTVHLTDIMPPELIGVPADVTVNKDHIPKVFPIDARDNSGVFCEVTFEESIENQKIIRTWSATDSCGNTVTGRQVITLK